MAEESAVDTTGHAEESAEATQVADEAPAPTEDATQDEAPEPAAEVSTPTAEEKAEADGAEASADPETPADDAAAVEEPPTEDGEAPPAAPADEPQGDGEPGAEGDEKAEPVAAEKGGGDAPATEEATAEGEQQEGGEGAVATTEQGEAAPPAAEGEAGSQQDGETAPAPAEGDEAAPADAEGEGAAVGDTDGAPGEGEGEAAPTKDDEAATAEGDQTAEGAEAGHPTSDEFADGERPESPPRVSEKLSREPTPTAEEQMRTADRIDEVDEEAERPDPSSPDAIVATFDELEIDDADEEEADAEEEEDDYEEEEVEEEEFDREHMIASYKQAMQEREQKLHQNSLLQTKLSDHFRRKKADQGGPADAGQETEKSITDQEQRYAKFVYNLDELRHTRDTKRQEFDDRIEELELECQRREEDVRLQFQNLLDAKRKVGLKSVSATNGRPFPAVTQTRSDGSGGKVQDLLSTSVDDMLQDEAALEDQVVRVRLDNIGLSNRVRKCETALKAKEELSEGLHMIDFEQLKIENQTYNEKIEERQEELLKLKKKITNNVQVLTHLKEKLQFVQCKKQEQCGGLDELDQTLSKRRDQLTRTKQARDSLRNHNQRLKQNSGLLGNEALLRNFEENVDLTTEKRERLDELKMEHSEMTLQCSKLKRKIEVARAQSAQ